MKKHLPDKRQQDAWITLERRGFRTLRAQLLAVIGWLEIRMTDGRPDRARGTPEDFSIHNGQQ
jgi:hypothetical protein